jgi:AraC-like DNA-binding protein
MKLYSEYYLSKKAERFVNKIWVLDNTQNDQAVKHKKVLPNGCFNLALVTGNGWEVIIKNRCYKMVTGTYLNAQITQKAIINIESKTKVILIQLHAWAISLFPKYDLTKFRDVIIQIGSKNLPFLHNIEPAFYNDVNKVIELTNKNFEELSDNNPEKTLTELMCVSTELHNEKILKTLEGVKYSNRALQIEFKKSTGLTRKQYSRLINLRKTVDYISHPENEASNLTSIAYKSGYFDQTHFIKTFKEIVEITPKKFDAQSFLLSQKR